MTIAGTLTVNVLANTSKFVKGITTARDKLGAFGKRVKGLNTSVSGFGATLLGVGGFAGFAAFARSTVESVDKLSKLSEQIGTTTEDLGLLTFQANLSGVEQDKLGKALLRMSRTLSDATSGLKSAERPLERIGLKATDLVNMKPGEAFQQIAQAVKQMENPLQRSATMMEIFGRAGAELIPLINSDLEGAARSFERMGGAISQAEADKLVAFKDAVTELREAAGVFGRNFVIGISEPALEAVRGLQVIMENLNPQARGAFEKTVEAKRGTRGSIFNAERARQASARFLGELLGSRVFQRDPRGLDPISQEIERQQLLELQRTRAAIESRESVTLEPARGF